MSENTLISLRLPRTLVNITDTYAKENLLDRTTVITIALVEYLKENNYIKDNSVFNDRVKLNEFGTAADNDAAYITDWEGTIVAVVAEPKSRHKNDWSSNDEDNFTVSIREKAVRLEGTPCCIKKYTPGRDNMKEEVLFSCPACGDILPVETKHLRKEIGLLTEKEKFEIIKKTTGHDCKNVKNLLEKKCQGEVEAYSGYFKGYSFEIYYCDNDPNAEPAWCWRITATESNIHDVHDGDACKTKEDAIKELQNALDYFLGL